MLNEPGCINRTVANLWSERLAFGCTSHLMFGCDHFRKVCTWFTVQQIHLFQGGVGWVCRWWSLVLLNFYIIVPRGTFWKETGAPPSTWVILHPLQIILHCALHFLPTQRSSNTLFCRNPHHIILTSPFSPLTILSPSPAFSICPQIIL